MESYLWVLVALWEELAKDLSTGEKKNTVRVAIKFI